jgi:hypothetical protein
MIWQHSDAARINGHLPKSSCTWYDAGKEAAMIELTEEQRQSIDQQEQPPVVVDPRTGQEYLLIRREIYEQVKGILRPFNRGWEDDSEMDAYEKYRKNK